MRSIEYQAPFLPWFVLPDYTINLENVRLTNAADTSLSKTKRSENWSLLCYWVPTERHTNRCLLTTPQLACFIKYKQGMDRMPREETLRRRWIPLTGWVLVSDDLREGVVEFGDGRETLHALPQTVRLAHRRLPESQSAVLGAWGVQLTVRREPYTVHRPKVTLERFCNTKYSLYFPSKRYPQTLLRVESTRMSRTGTEENWYWVPTTFLFYSRYL